MRIKFSKWVKKAALLFVGVAVILLSSATINDKGVYGALMFVIGGIYADIYILIDKRNDGAV